MKRNYIVTGAALLVSAFICQVASAKTLEDILKEKGVISQADYQEITKVKPLDYKIGKGFTFTSQDELFQLSIGGRMQFRYTFFDKDGANSQDVSQWDAKRVKFTMYGYAFTKDLTYGLQLNLRSGGNAQMLQDAFLNYKVIDEAQLKLGQYKTPFSRQELTSDGNLSFVDRSPVVDAFKHSYDIGTSVNGKIANGLAYYDVGVFGGAGQTTGRSTNDNMFAARVVVNPLGDMAYSEGDLDMSKKPLVSVGANYFRNTIKKSTGTAAGSTPTLETTVPNYTNASSNGWLGKGFNKTVGGVNVFGGNTAGTSTKFDIDSYGVDAAFKWMGLSVQGEYLLGQAEANNGNLLRAQGFYTQAGYMLIPKKLEVAFRYSYLDPDRDVTNNSITEQIGAVSYYFSKHALKLQADVGNIHTQTGVGTATDEMQYRMQAQITF